MDSVAGKKRILPQNWINFNIAVIFGSG